MEEQNSNINKIPVYNATGRRKTSVAKVRLIPGTGKIRINSKSFDKYFNRDVHRKTAVQALELTATLKQFDVIADVTGGGVTGQAGAVGLGVARALIKFDKSLRPILVKERYLTRDSRMVERKKYGLRGARRRSQFTKR